MDHTAISPPGGSRDADAPSRWTAPHVEGIARQTVSYAPLIGKAEAKPVSKLGIWDTWPVQQPDGRPAVLDGGQTLWMALAAPRFADPDERHAHARIHLFLRHGAHWTELGPVLPEGFSPGSREWSGSALLEPGSDWVTLYFTASGRRGESVVSFEQRLFQARAKLERDGGEVRFTQWRDLRESVERDPAYYMATDLAGGPGTIKAFRDPFVFRDPSDGRKYLLFAGSAAESRSPYNGVVGMAAATEEDRSGWRALSPLISADGLNNELERPHVIHYGGLYYLFWSTQREVFNPAGPSGPTGLYGMVASAFGGSWEPLNGTGLVFANPPEAPKQAYGWLVLPDLSVISFVDDWRDPGDPSPTRRFGGTFAPEVTLHLEGADAGIERS